MKKIIYLAILILFSANLYAKKIDLPKISAEEAIAEAKVYIEKNHVLVSESDYLLKIEYLNIYNEYEKAHWRLFWERHPRTKDGLSIKGGWFVIKVFNNKKVVAVYGE